MCFCEFLGFTWISRLCDHAKYQKPCIGVWTGIHYIHYITANILQCHHWFPLNMTSENRAQKFCTLSTQIWVVLWLVDNLLHPIIKSTAQIWVMLCHQYGIPALVSETFLWGNQCWCHQMFDRLSHLGIWAIIPCSPYMVIVHVLVSLRLEASWDFFPKDRMAPKENRFNSSSTRKCNFIGKKKN